MGEATSIAWTSATFNPWWGCTKVSPACDSCLPADTLVLDSHLRHVRIGDLNIGDTVLGYDESPGIGENRHLRISTVEGKWTTQAPTVTFTMGSGRTHTASVDHRWLARVRPAFRTTETLRLGTDLIALYAPPILIDFDSDAYLAGYLGGASDGDGTWRRLTGQYRERQCYWRVAEPDFDLAILNRLVLAVERLTGHHIEIRSFDNGSGGFPSPYGREPMSKVETRRSEVVDAIVDIIEQRLDSDDFAAGWLAGIVDTDGCHESSNLRVAQSKPNDVRDTVKRYGTQLGFDWRNEDFSDSCPTVRLYGDAGDRIRFAVTVGGAVARKALGAVIGMMMPRRPDPVVAVARGPVMDLVDIQTSTGTFVLADGMATHNCYAEAFAKRTGHDVWGKDASRRFFGDKHWAEPLTWDRKAARSGEPFRVFCASMADVFEANPVLEDERKRLWQLVGETPHLTWQLLTKRPENVLRMAPGEWLDEWPAHVWIGTTVEDEQRARIRIPRLLRVPARVRFLSMEPLLGPVALWPWLDRGIGWVVVGGESGPHRRPFDLDWTRSVRDECAEATVPFFFKQDAGLRPGTPGPVDLQIREFPDA